MNTTENRALRIERGCRRVSAVALVTLGSFVLAGCGADDAEGRPGLQEGLAGAGGGLFGGEPEPPNPEAGAPGAEPGSAGAGLGGAGAGGTGSGSGGRCGAVPESSEPRIDNFEDGDSTPIVEPGRLAAWHLPPLNEGETLSFVVEQGGANQTDFAAHATVAGFSERTSVVANLRFDAEGVSCPYNASGYTGVGFYVKGTGNLDLLLDTTDTWSTEFGGTCVQELEQCWDVHHKLVPLSDEWQYHEVTWDLFSQAGWGKLAPFEPQHLLGVEFAVLAGSAPAEFWVDELRFLEP